MDKEEIVSKLKEIQIMMAGKPNELHQLAADSYDNDDYDSAEFYSGAALAYLHYFSVIGGLVVDIELAELGDLSRG